LTLIRRFCGAREQEKRDLLQVLEWCQGEMIMLLCHHEYANLLLVVRYDMTIQDEKRLDDDTDLVTREMGPSHGTPVHHEDSIASSWAI